MTESFNIDFLIILKLYNLSYLMIPEIVCVLGQIIRMHLINAVIKAEMLNHFFDSVILGWNNYNNSKFNDFFIYVWMYLSM